MIYGRVMLSGLIVWLLILSTFFIMDSISVTQQSLYLQGLLMMVLAPAYAGISAWFFYRKGNLVHGCLVGLFMTLTALALDALITVPFIEIPRGSSYWMFFTNGLLWTLAASTVIVVSLYWRYRVYPFSRHSG